MSTSNNRNFLVTRDDIILSALSKIGAVPLGSSPTSAQTTRAALALNAVVKSLHNFGVYLWEATTGNFTVITGQTTPYSIGADVVAIESPFVRISGIDTPLTLMPRDEYMSIPDKDQTGQPIKIMQELTLVDLQATVWPVGVTGTTYVIYYTQYKKLQDFDSGVDDMAFPTHWIQALIYALARDLAPEYSLSVQERQMLKQDALEFITQALGNSRESGSLIFKPNIKFRG